MCLFCIGDSMGEECVFGVYVVVVRLSVSFISFCPSCLEIAEFPDGVHWSSP